MRWPMKKCILEGLLLLCMLAILPTTAFAVEGQDGECAVNSTLTVEAEEPIDLDSKPIEEDLKPPEENVPEAVDPSKESASPTEEAPETEEPPKEPSPTESCTKIDGCTLEEGHEGECAVEPEEPETPEEPSDEIAPQPDSGSLDGEGAGDDPENEESLDTSNVIEVDTADKLVTAVENASSDTPTTIQINADLRLTGGIATNKKIILTSKEAHTITFSSMAEKGIGFNIYGGGSLTIGSKGDNENTLTLIMESTEGMRCLVNCGNGYFVLNSGELKSEDASMTRGIVCLTNKSTFEMNGGKINGNSEARNVWVDSSTFTMNNGEITNGKANNQGGGVYLTGTNPSFIMNGGLITQCEAIYNGGGVALLMSNATFEMNGGTILGCTSNVGGGVYMSEGENSFTMKGGTITGCTAKYGGGGVYMENNNTFTMNDGTISNCGRVDNETTRSNGGGVYVKGANASFTMNGGKILNCKAPDNNGGGIYADGATVTIKGTISNCEANFGGGVSSAGKLNIETGGVIEKCKAATHGGGVFVNGSEAELTMDGGVITDCTALQGGGAFFREGKTFTLNAGEISRCTATGNKANGGGVFLQKIGEFSMSGGKISGNTAPYLGGGIYMGQEDTPVGSYRITAGEISQNKVTDPYGFGGGIYVQKGITLNLADTLVTENTASALGGGIWACRTGDIKIYVTDGGAVYGNDAQGENGTKTPDQAGDDIAFVASLGTNSTMTLYQKMLGGGFNHYYKDGGITWLEPGADHTAGLGLGAPDGKTSRYGENYKELCTDTENMTGFTALKNIVSKDAKEKAVGGAKLIITGNSASRGGGIGTNGNLIIGNPSDKTYSVNVTKEWSQDTPAEKKKAVTVYLKIGDEQLGPVTLNESNGWKATFTGLTDNPEEVAYTAVENPIPEGFAPVVSKANIDSTNKTISINIENIYIPTGNLSVSKTVSGSTGDTQKEFHFTVTLSDKSINGGYGDMTFAGGVATFVLKHGEIKTAYNLPAKITYEVIEQEANQGGYTTSSVGEIGTITADTTANVTFKNHKGGGGPSDTYTSVSVKKVWKLDDGGTAADSVEVSLLKDGAEHDRVTLNAGNSWSHTWNHLNDKYHWTVEEIAVPDGFTVSINREPGNRFVITNDDKPSDPDDPDDPDNPDDPDDPDEPDKPVNPDNPDTPDTPDQPDEIEVPDPPVPTDTVDVPGTPNDVPQTGDNAHLSLWAALALLSAAGLVFTQFSGKMNHKSKHGVK